MTSLRIAAFGLRIIPPKDGSSGSDTFADELYTRLAGEGHEVTVYCRIYKNTVKPDFSVYRNVKLVYFRTVSTSGFDTLFHSFLSTLHIIFFNTGKIVHIHNGGNSIWALPLRLFGKKVFISQDGIDWDRAKWKWYARLYLRISTFLTAFLPTNVIFDNIYLKEKFENKFHRNYLFIPYGSTWLDTDKVDTLTHIGVKSKGYFLFVGRFIPEKGIHYLIEAFLQLKTDKMLVLVGGSPNPNTEFEQNIRSFESKQILFPGYIYGENMLQLMKHSYCYIQPSDIEGLSPVILTAMGMGTPTICSNIPENVYVVNDTALLFEKGKILSLKNKMEEALNNPQQLADLAARASERARRLFSWESVTKQFEDAFLSQ
jgi:glycosyltransferase involved in cell wall biosynthesis